MAVHCHAYYRGVPGPISVGAGGDGAERRESETNYLGRNGVCSRGRWWNYCIQGFQKAATPSQLGAVDLPLQPHCCSRRRGPGDLLNEIVEEVDC